MFLAVATGFGQDYQRDIHPIFAAKCLQCHSQQRRSGGLSLGTYQDALDGGRSGAAIKPGSSAASLLVSRITGESTPRMPLNGDPLPASELALIRSWIDQGARPTPTAAAAKPKWEAPLTLTAPAVPVAPWKQWQKPLDRITAAYLIKIAGAGNTTEPEVVSDAQ